MTNSVEANEFQNHEALHAAHMVSDLFDRHLLDHPAVANNPELRKVAAEISERLGAFYQLCGSELN